MKATFTEIQIINRLKNCTFLPGSFDKKFPRNLDVNNISPLQQWWIYFLGYKYRKQIGNDILETICKFHIDNNDKPISRKEAGKILKNIKHGMQTAR